MNLYTDWGLSEVINANGKMTILGASAVNPKVAAAVEQALQDFVIMEDFMDYTGKVIARITGSEAGCPTCGAASGMAIAAAACIAGDHLKAIERIPNTEGLANQIILQKGQNVNFGGNLSQMLSLGGAVVVEVGCANKVEREHIESSINDQTAALIYVKSHHAVQKGMQSIETMVTVAHDHNLPLIVDAAAEEDFRKYISLGADLVIYSGGKALSGPTSGFIAGKKTLIAACRKQYKGIGRAMKISKEAMAGLVVALEQYDPEQIDTGNQSGQMQQLCDALNQIEGLLCQVVQDEAGRAIYRAEIQVDAQKTGLTAVQLEEQLRTGNPAIYLRNYYMHQGILSIDPRPLLAGQTDIIVKQIHRLLAKK